jgi:hypothetical protein
MTILTMPSIPNSLKLIAQGYRKITSTSNNTKIATRKYFTENGIRAFPIPSTFQSFYFYFWVLVYRKL